MLDAILPPGTKVRWRSQSGASWKEKAGIVIAHLPKNEDALEAMKRAGHSGILTGQRRSLIERYLVRVQTGPNDVRYYTPRASSLRRCVPEKEATTPTMVSPFAVYECPDCQTRTATDAPDAYPGCPQCGIPGEAMEFVSLAQMVLIDLDEDKGEPTVNDDLRPIDAAPTDGTAIIGVYEDGEEILIEWRERRI